MNRRLVAISLILLGCFVLLAGGAASAAPLPQPQPLAVRLTGTLNIVAGDHQDLTMPPIEVVTLVDSAGGETVLLISDTLRETLGLDFYRLNGQEVTVTGSPGGAGPGPATLGPADDAVFNVTAIEPVMGAQAAVADTAVSGNTRWLTIACKFADFAEEPQPLSFFDDMYANSYASLDAYWREASAGQINLDGSRAVGWYVLPKPMSAYQIDDTYLRLSDLLLDCAAQADPQVNFTEYMGINIMLNGSPGCCAWGGNATVTLDGVQRQWKVTWIPKWGYRDLGYVQHEMTHAYGILWHSYANDNAYGDYWDVVSQAMVAYYSGHPRGLYGYIGQHTQAYHRAYLGWTPPERILTVGPGVTQVKLARTTQPGPNGFLMAIVPIGGSTTHFYAVEARRLVGFDDVLKGNSITIHEIGGSPNPVQLMDPYAIGVGYGRYVWKVGDTWVAPQGNITVHVDAASTSGFDVTIRTGLETQTVMLPVLADTYVDGEAAQTNFGQSPILKTKAAFWWDVPFSKAAFLRFDPQLLPENIIRAEMRLTLAEGTISGHLPRVEYVQFEPAWQESALTWANTRDTFTSFYAPEVYSPTALGNNWMAWDLSGLLTIWGPDVLTALKVDNGEFIFSSREGANPPVLVIEYLVEPPGSTTTLTPTQDAFVKEAAPTTAYGTATNLNVQDAAKDQRTYLKFDLGGVSGSISRATLRLYANLDAPQGGTVYPVSNTYAGTTTPWLETGLTWAKAPALSAAPLGTLGPVTAGGWVEIDVTAAAQAAQTAGPLNLGLGGGSATRAAYSSKEGDFPPELVIETGTTPLPPPEPTTATFTPTNDAHVQQAYPTKSYGTAKTIRVRDAAKDINAYVKFNLTGVSGVEQATLRLYGADAGPDGGDVFVVSPYYAGTTTLWLDNGLKWTNAPSISGAPVATIGPVKAKKWVEVDVTAAVVSALSAGDGRLSLAIRNHSTNVVAYSSKEGTRPPELVVVYRP